MYLKNLKILLCLLFLVLLACSDNNIPTTAIKSRFDESKSDQKAIEIADKVMQAMGGKKNWNETRFIVWDFFGARKLYWDKWTGNVRIESQKDNYIVLVNVNDLSGKVKQNEEVMTEPDSLKKYLEIGKSMWINDSYWLVMPFKLKDPGVTLKYLRQDTTSEGKIAEVIQLTFETVGETPENKYEVYVDQKTNLVAEWAYFVNANDEEPKFKSLWRQYKRHGNILLSSDRGEGYALKDIEVLEEMPLEVFTEF